MLDVQGQSQLLCVHEKSALMVLSLNGFLPLAHVEVSPHVVTGARLQTRKSSDEIAEADHHGIMNL